MVQKNYINIFACALYSKILVFHNKNRFRVLRNKITEDQNKKKRVCNEHIQLCLSTSQRLLWLHSEVEFVDIIMKMFKSLICSVFLFHFT